MPWRAASTASGYVPTLLAVSPLAAIRSAPTSTTSTSPACINEPGALQVRPRLVDPDVDLTAGVVRDLDHAQRGPELAARQRTRVAVRQDPQRPVDRHGQGRQPELRQPAVVGRRLE